MPQNCAVIGCMSRGGRNSERKFFSFPMLRKVNAKSLAITQARQQAWFIALNRDDFFAYQYQDARVCDLHFISGRSACYTDVDDPDWVSSKHLGYEKEESNHGSTEALNEIDPVSSELVDVSLEGATSASKETQTFTPTSSTYSQTDGTITGISAEQILSYEEQIKLLEEMLNAHNVSLNNFNGDDKKKISFSLDYHIMQRWRLHLQW